MYIGEVKLADFQSSGQRKRVYVATEQGVVAALNLRSGEIGEGGERAPTSRQPEMGGDSLGKTPLCCSVEAGAGGRRHCGRAASEQQM